MMSAVDALFSEAVSAIDRGNVAELEHIFAQHPSLVRERLEDPGAWLRDKVGKALDDFFARPYLLWFVAEDPVRNGVLPSNIADVAGTIVRAIGREAMDSSQEQIDYALRLVAWSWIARDCGVQIALLDVLLDAGATADGRPEDALVNGNLAAAGHLVERGARLPLATALCLGRWSDAARLGVTASAQEKQFALTMCALRGKAEALAQLIGLGVDLGMPSPDLYSHATALHHAVYSGSLETVKVLVEAGAPLDVKDSAYGGTPLGWADYGKHDDIAMYLRERSGV
jgi:hypothetical protein